MISLKRISEAELEALWQISFKEESPEWVKWDAPYLHTYFPLSFSEFKRREARYFLSESVKGVYLNEELIGAVSFYWENRRIYWLEQGLVIFNPEYWGKGYGSTALALWTDELFMTFPEIARVGFTTWSANEGMMNVGKNLNYQLETRARQVIFYEGEYYDSIGMGLLRSEWERKT